MDLTDFILVDTFNFPIKNGIVIFPSSYFNSRYILELEDIRRYPAVRAFINSDTCYRLEIMTIDKQRAFVFIRYTEKVTVLYFNHN